jgi:hypothetical protein
VSNVLCSNPDSLGPSSLSKWSLLNRFSVLMSLGSELFQGGFHWSNLIRGHRIARPAE